MGQIPNFGAPPDSSLTVSGKAADAKVVGDKIDLLSSRIATLEDKEQFEILKMFSSMSQNSSAADLYTYSFARDYKQELIIITMHDTDNNSDNYCGVFDSQQSGTAWNNFKNNSTNWHYFGVQNFIPSGTALAKVKDNYTTDENKNKTLYYEHGSSDATCFQVLAWKKNIKAGDTAYIYVNTYRRSLVTILGLN